MESSWIVSAQTVAYYDIEQYISKCEDKGNLLAIQIDGQLKFNKRIANMCTWRKTNKCIDKFVKLTRR